jgi:DNA invertase Pin-like site-specific DNA recombinase
MGRPIAYLRRSRVDTRKPGVVSHEQQLQAIRELAAKAGDDPDALLILEDWGRSGRASKQHLRTSFAEMEQMVADGTASAIYAYSANRLARSLETLARLAHLCQEKKVPIRCADGYSPDVSTATGRMVLGILGTIYAWQAEWTKERAVEGVDARRERGDRIGPAPWGKKVVGGQLVDNPDESVEEIAAAYAEAGSYQGAARLLASRGVKSRRGRWAASAVRSILRNGKPGVVSPTVHRGRPPKRDFRLGGLLRCPCGGILTGKNERGGTVSYECKKAGEDPNHTRPRSIAESKLLPWIVEESARYDEPSGDVADQAVVEQQRADLLARRERVSVDFIDGGIDRAEAIRRRREIDDELVILPTVAPGPLPVILDPMDWPPRQYNDELRQVWRHVDLGHDLRPVRAEWRDPSWRYGGEGLPPSVRVELERVKRESVADYLNAHPEIDEVAGYRRRRQS